jgi:hypothetical protein
MEDEYDYVKRVRWEWKEIEGKSEKRMKMENERRIKRNFEEFREKIRREWKENKKMRKENQESL